MTILREIKLKDSQTRVGEVISVDIISDMIISKLFAAVPLAN